MTTRAAAKPARSIGKTTLKTTGKNQGKGDKQSANVLEIVPGKFNETDWLSIIETDETEDFITDIFDHIWNETSKQIQELYLRRQLLSFTLMRTEDALSNVIQWAFLERDKPKPRDGNFWIEDDEPIPCSMDNWGEGVVPACREQRPQDIDTSSVLISERSPSAPISPQIAEDLDQSQRPLTSSTHSDIHSKYSHETDLTRPHNETIQSTDDDIDTPIFNRKEYITDRQTRRLSFEKKPSTHDILVIESQPPKLEPLGDLFQRTSTTITPKRRRMIVPKLSSQFGSDTIRSATNVTETSSTTVTKSMKRAESKLFDDQYIEQIISKAPVAAHSMLKSILSRPPGYRELELNEDGNVASIVKLDPDKFGSRNIHVSCDVVKPRKSMIEIRSPPKQARKMKLFRSDPKFAPVKLVLQEQSTDVGDLIQTMPGVIYEDSKLRKGDSGRYQTGMARYTNFYDESRPLKPIARSGDVAIVWASNDASHKSIDYNHENDNQQDLQITKLHRFTRIPPIMSASSTASST